MAERTGTKPMVIIGGGKAGGTAAATLREDGFGGPVVIISAEPGIPFGRPPLSKTYLRSAEDLEGWYIKPASWYEEHDVELLAESTVTAIDATAHSLALASGRELEYQKLLLATGGRNRRLQIPGAELPWIYYLRTVAECDAIKRDALAGRRVVVVGMGFIGSEVAASLTQLGVHVTAVFPGSKPLERILGEQIGALIGEIHRSVGSGWCPGLRLWVRRDRPAGGGDRRRGSHRVRLCGRRRGDRARCASRLRIVPGAAERDPCRRTVPASAADIYRPATSPTIPSVLGRVRVGITTAPNITERRGGQCWARVGDYIHNFWSDQYEHVLQYVGHATKWDDFTVRGSLEEGMAVGFYLDAGVVRAAIGFDRGGDPEWEPDSEMAACAHLVARRAQPDRRVLADEHTDPRGPCPVTCRCRPRASDQNYGEGQSPGHACSRGRGSAWVRKPLTTAIHGPGGQMVRSS
jgi:3-phenylpropionate/trans-cinnamate dioxygenase ferredoxin reductase subunit